MFEKIDVKVLIFYETLVNVCSINFEITFRQNCNDMTNHLSGIFAKLNFERNCAIIEKKYFSCIMFKTFRNIIAHGGIKLVNIYAYKNAQLFLNFNVEILQHEILHIQHTRKNRPIYEHCSEVFVKHPKIVVLI